MANKIDSVDHSFPIIPILIHSFKLPTPGHLEAVSLVCICSRSNISTLRLTSVKEDTNFDHTVKIIDHLATRFLNSEKLMILSTSYNTEPNLDPCCCDIFWKITVYIANKSSERRTITWTWGGVYNIRAQLIVFAFILNYVLLYNTIGLTTSMWREGSVRNRQEIARINVRNEEKITENEYLTFGDTVDAT